jgi:AmmeMemoRadiSam system protein B/AmmeMemoRadiSam system protein A
VKRRKRSLFPGVFIHLALFSLLPAQGIRPDVWSGQFYPGDPALLSRQIQSFLEEAGKRPPAEAALRAIIVPHAGYVYSGRVAACAYALVQDMTVETAVILSPSHRVAFRGCSISKAEGYRTPLGVAAVDGELSERLSEETGYGFLPKAHEQEHAVEVQVPFIQTVLPKAKILPVVMGTQDKQTITRLARGLSRILPGRKALIVVSTDMSHYLPKKEANIRDGRTASWIRDLRVTRLIEELETGENIMCGGGGVAAAILAAQEWGKPFVEILKYADSGDAGGPDSGVVGYLAAALTVSDKAEAAEDFSLTPADKKTLLSLARASIREAVLHNRLPEHTPDTPLLNEKRGAFVTLKKDGRLRGCIGFIEAVNPLYRTVMEAAAFAALRDRRFRPVTAEEIGELTLEISVLSPLQQVKKPRSIQVGRHGLMIIKGERQGLLLPQVPVEQAWNRTTFLRQTCLKAGLPADAWKSGAEIYVFEAVVFSEEEISGRGRDQAAGLPPSI